MTDKISNAPVESWDVADVKPYERNNKKHPPKQIEQLAASIADQGLNDPITVDDGGVIISGHGRYEAILKLGWTKVPIRCLRGISEAKAAKLRIAANKTSSTEYDLDVLSEELERLSILGENITVMGFDSRELEMLMDDLGEMSDAAITDIDTAVSDFDDDVLDAAAKAEGSDISLSKAFDIKRLPLRSQKVAGLFMKRIEELTGLTGADALMAHMEAVTND